MNIPFRFALNTSTEVYGRLFDYAGADGWENQTLKSIAAIPGSPDGLGLTATLRLQALQVLPPSRAFYINGFSLTAWYADSTQNVKCDFGLYDTVNSVFVPIYECPATGDPAGGIQKTFGSQETGIYVPQSDTLLPSIRVTKQGATDGDVTVAGDLSLYAILP